MLQIVTLGSRFLKSMSNITLAPYYLGFLRVMISQILEGLEI